MKEDWVQRLKQKMAGFEEPVPSAPLPFTPARRRLFFPWPVFAVAAAGVAVAAVLLWPRRDIAPVQIVSNAIEAPVQANLSANDNTEAEQVDGQEKKPVKQGAKLLAYIDEPVEPEIGERREPAREVIPEEEPATAEHFAAEVTQPWTDDWAELLAQEENTPRNRRKVNISFFAQTTPFASANSLSHDDGSDVVPGNPPGGPGSTPPQGTDPPSGSGPLPPDVGSGGDGDDDDDKPETKAGDVTFGRRISPSSEESAEWSHRFPLQLGFRVSADLSHGFGLETGLSYIRFLSERNGAEQVLHYMGVPIRLRYDFLNARSFSLYGSLGAGAFKCVAGNGPDRPWLFAADAGAGIGWNLLPHAGVYAETGCGRYFHTGESEHYYTEHPFALTLMLGVRFDL